MEDALEPVFHVYVVTPLAVNVVEEPEQTDIELTAMEGALPTTTEAVDVLMQPAAEVPVTV